MKEINSLQEYNEFIKENKVIVLFYTKWCPICKMINYLLEEYEEENEIIVGKVCITDITDVTEETKVQNAPTLFFYQDGNLMEKRHGKLEWEDIDEIYYH